MELVQCNASKAITGTIRGTAREKLSQDLGLNYFNIDVGIENFVVFFKFFKHKTLNYVI